VIRITAGGHVKVEEKPEVRNVSSVERMLELHKRLQDAGSDSEREVMQRQIEATDRQIDALVYELYGLTAEEVAVVEG